MISTNNVRRGVSAIAGILLTFVTVAVGLVAVQMPQAAKAASAPDFNPGSIISDSAFYDSNAMTERQIQAFLVAKGSGLQSLTFDVADRAKLVSDSTGTTRCEAFQGGLGLLASTIIYRAQVACGISAKVILVTLNKEQGLISKASPSQAALNRAMGYACPDSGACAPSTLGFGNQVYTGTLQLKSYKASNFGRQPGLHSIQWSPNGACGSSVVNVQNYATAALYNYTPYQPNASAMANVYAASNDPCSSYGNRNFWVFYTDWFGDPQIVIPAGVSTSRVGGEDRYAVSAAISLANFPGKSSVVYVATGEDFPDALSAAPAAAKLGAPLLLVRPNEVPAVIATELRRLHPTQIVVAGGPASVSEAVYGELAGFAQSIRRDWGEDRYDASLAVTESAFGSGGAPTAYLATGATFPDALSASAAAGSIGAPVILVRGVDSSLDSRTRSLLVSLGVNKVLIAGGPASVSSAIQDSIRALPGMITVTRIGGDDRYIVSGQTNHDAFTSASKVFVASGLTFPDALSGAAIAGSVKSPLYVIPPTCVPSYVLEDIVAMRATQMIILGGSASVSSPVEKFAQCKKVN